jgi:3-dehydroquinate synthetase
MTLRQQRLLVRLRLPTAPPPLPIDDLLSVMRNDKKAVAGRLRLVLPRRLGEVALFDDVPDAEVRRVLEECFRPPSSS